MSQQNGLARVVSSDLEQLHTIVCVCCHVIPSGHYFFGSLLLGRKLENEKNYYYISSSETSSEVIPSGHYYFGSLLLAADSMIFVRGMILACENKQ